MGDGTKPKSLVTAIAAIRISVRVIRRGAAALFSLADMYRSGGSDTAVERVKLRDRFSTVDRRENPPIAVNNDRVTWTGIFSSRCTRGVV